MNVELEIFQLKSKSLNTFDFHIKIGFFFKLTQPILTSYKITKNYLRESSSKVHNFGDIGKSVKFERN